MSSVQRELFEEPVQEADTVSNEELIAQMFQLVSPDELIPVIKDRGKDCTVVFCLIVLQRLIAIDVSRYQAQMTMIWKLLHQRLESGSRGAWTAYREAYQVHPIIEIEGRKQEANLLTRMQRAGFCWNGRRWTAYRTPAAQSVYEEWQAEKEEGRDQVEDQEEAGGQQTAAAVPGPDLRQALPTAVPRDERRPERTARRRETRDPRSVPVHWRG